MFFKSLSYKTLQDKQDFINRNNSIDNLQSYLLV